MALEGQEQQAVEKAGQRPDLALGAVQSLAVPLVVAVFLVEDLADEVANAQPRTAATE